MISKYIEKIVENDNEKDMRKLSKMLSEVLYELKDYDMESFEKYKMCLYEMAYGKVLTDEVKQEWVYSMKPKAKWDMSDIDNVIKEYDISVPKMSLYVIMNMLYSDFKSVLGEDTQLYIQASSDWYFDEDIQNTEEAKLYNYYKYIVK